MSPIALSLDEHVQLALAETLRARGVDILTTQQAKNIGLHDLDQLAFAAQDRRSLFSYDKRHFARIHYEWSQKIVISLKPQLGL